jgi:hypothetical protein
MYGRPNAVGGVWQAGSWIVGIVGAVRWWSSAGDVADGGASCRKWLVMGGGGRLRGEKEQRVKSEEEGVEGKWGGKMKMDSRVLSSFFFFFF